MFEEEAGEAVVLESLQSHLKSMMKGLEERKLVLISLIIPLPWFQHCLYHCAKQTLGILYWDDFHCPKSFETFP